MSETNSVSIVWQFEDAITSDQSISGALSDASTEYPEMFNFGFLDEKELELTWVTLSKSHSDQGGVGYSWEMSDGVSREEYEAQAPERIKKEEWTDAQNLFYNPREPHLRLVVTVEHQ